MLTIYCLYIFKVILLTVNITNYNRTNMDVHRYETRARNNIHIERVYHSSMAKDPFVSGPKFFNNLPPNIKELKGKCFKKALFYYLVERPLYGIEEFFVN